MALRIYGDNNILRSENNICRIVVRSEVEMGEKEDKYDSRVCLLLWFDVGATRSHALTDFDDV